MGKVAGVEPATGELSTFCAIRFAPITLLPFRAYRLGRVGRANGLPESFIRFQSDCSLVLANQSQGGESNSLMAKFPELHRVRGFNSARRVVLSCGLSD